MLPEAPGDLCQPHLSAHVARTDIADAAREAAVEARASAGHAGVNILPWVLLCNFSGLKETCGNKTRLAPFRLGWNASEGADLSENR